MTRSSLAKNAHTGRAASRKPKLPSKPAKLSLSPDLMAKSTKRLMALDQDLDLAAKRPVVILTRALMTTLTMTPLVMTLVMTWTALLPRRSNDPACLPKRKPLPIRREDKQRKKRREDARRESRKSERKEREEPERKGRESRDKRKRGSEEKKRSASGKRRRKLSAKGEKKRKRPHAKLLLKRRNRKKRNAVSRKRGSARRP